MWWMAIASMEMDMPELNSSEVAGPTSGLKAIWHSLSSGPLYPIVSGLFQYLNDNPLLHFSGSRIHNSPNGPDVPALFPDDLPDVLFGN